MGQFLFWYVGTGYMDLLVIMVLSSDALVPELRDNSDLEGSDDDDDKGYFDSLLSESEEGYMPENDGEASLGDESEVEMGIGSRGTESYVFSLLAREHL